MLKGNIFCIATLFSTLILASCSHSSLNEVRIGKQTWMRENLNVTAFRNGDLIAEAKNQEQWDEHFKKREPCWTYYDFDPEYGLKYGKLYNWYAVTDPRGLVPLGWHIPSLFEWNSLFKYLSNEDDISCAIMKASPMLRSKTGWLEPKNELITSCSDLGYFEDTMKRNSTGFNALPGGRILNTPSSKIEGDGGFDKVGICGYWWSSSQNENDTENGFWVMLSVDRNLELSSNMSSSGGGQGISIRCIKD